MLASPERAWTVASLARAGGKPLYADGREGDKIAPNSGKRWRPNAVRGKRQATMREKCNRFTVPPASALSYFGPDATPAVTTLYAARGRLIPFNANSPTGSTCTVFSTFVSTRGLMRICPGFASSQSREATLDTVPMAA